MLVLKTDKTIPDPRDTDKSLSGACIHFPSVILDYVRRRGAIKMMYYSRVCTPQEIVGGKVRSITEKTENVSAQLFEEYFAESKLVKDFDFEGAAEDMVLALETTKVTYDKDGKVVTEAKVKQYPNFKKAT